MVFNIDLTKYKLVDLSWEVTPNAMPQDRPFDIREGRLGDGTLKYEITNTHTHVGTHIESPVHFYFKGKTCTDYPLDHFMGKAALLTTDIPECAPSVSLAHVKEQLEPRRGQFEILYVRNDTPRRPLYFDIDCVPYFAELGLKLFAFDSTINFGREPEDGRTFHDLLLSRDTLLIEFPANGRAIDKDLFYLFAMPLRIKDLDSSACRLFAVVER
ncbi:MAG: cyclase family protein [Candidatus Hydrogenedentes bacterium]|nr:cyclase family protein [Candidatus Hydrogenedentota bacterium]